MGSASGNSPMREDLNALEGDEYLLTWNAHNTKLAQNFYQMCKDEIFTDVTVATEERSFLVHKIVLSACSPYFRSVLFKASCRNPIIVLKDVSATHFALLLKYMYLGQVSVPKEELNNILRVADSLQIRGLSTNADCARSEDVLSRPVEANCDDDDNHGDRRLVVAPLGSEERMREAEVVDTLSKMPAVRSILAGARARSEHGSTGRKGYLPKRLRTSGDRDSTSSPRGCMSDPGLQAETTSTTTTGTGSPHGISDHNEGCSVGGASSEALGIITEPEEEDDEENEEDQPVDFSQSTVGDKEDKTAVSGAMHSKFSILSNYLRGNKMGRTRRQSEDVTASRGCQNEQSQLQGLSNPLDHYLKLLQNDAGGASEERTLALLGSLQETLGLDVNDRLKHYFSELPAQQHSSWMYNTTAAAADSANGVSRGLTNGSGSNRASPASFIHAGGALSSELGPNGKPMVSCEVCGKKLADPSSLYRHRKIHSGEKPHQCPFCERRFIQRYNMKQHLKTHRIHTMSKDYVEKLEPDLKDVVLSSF